MRSFEQQCCKLHHYCLGTYSACHSRQSHAQPQKRTAIAFVARSLSVAVRQRLEKEAVIPKSYLLSSTTEKAVALRERKDLKVDEE